MSGVSKRGWRDRFSFGRLLGGKAQRDELRDLGLTVLQDVKVEQRIQRMKEFNVELDKIKAPLTDEGTTPEEKLEHIEEQATIINRMLKEISVPYGRAGSNRWWAQIISGWATLHSQLMDQIISMQELMRQTDKRAREHRSGGNPGNPKDYEAPRIQKMQNFLGVYNFVVRVYAPYAEKIAGVAWKDEDMSPNWAAVIQSQSPYPGYDQLPPARSYRRVQESRRLWEPSEEDGEEEIGGGPSG